MTAEFVDSQTFQGGLVTMMPAHLLADGATPSCSNVDFSRSLGALVKRNGSSTLFTASGLAGATGLYEYIKAVGTTYIYEAIGTILYQVDPVPLYNPVYANGTAAGQSVTQISQTGGHTPIIVSKVGHGYSTGNTVVFYGVKVSAVGIVPGTTYTITRTDADNFTLDGTDTTTAIVGNQTDFWMVLTSGGTPSALGETNFITFDNLCIAVSPTLTTLKSTGGAFSPLLGTPPANGSFIENHKQKVFIAHTSAGNSRLHWSVTDDPEDWTTITGAATDAGYIDVGLDDGEVITGIKSIGSVLLVFKNTSTWILSGSNTTDFKVRKISPMVGCVANRTIVACDAFALFLSNLGVYSANSDNVTMVSYNIKPTLDALTSAQRAAAVAGRLNTQYWLALNLDADGSSRNEVVYYLDYVYGVWGKYSQTDFGAVFYTKRDGTLISARKVQGDIVQWDTTDNDDGSAIAWEWYTPEYDWGKWMVRKHPLDIMMSAYPISGKTITLTHLVDGISQGTTLSFSLTPTGSPNKVYLAGRHLPATSYGRYVQFKFSSSETSAPVKVFAFSIGAFLDKRQNG